MKFTAQTILFTLLVAATDNARGELMGRCGDCWCIPDNQSAGCPDDAEGITDVIDNTNVILSTFQLTNDPDFLKLQSADGGDCYPFADTLDPIDKYPKSNDPQCVKPSASPDAVCGYLYEEGATTCSGRNYEIFTYDNEAAATEAGAIITHKGGCGVCSTAQDYWAFMKTYTSLETDSLSCATTYLLAGDDRIDTRFDDLAACFVDIGFTAPCAEMWAHSSATTAAKCALQCLPDPVTFITALNGPPPLCEIEKCLQCSDPYQADFDAIVGRTLKGSGYTERIARKCSELYPILERDPCVGTESRGNVTTEAPTSTPENGTSNGSKINIWATTVLVAVLSVVANISA